MDTIKSRSNNEKPGCR